MTNLEKITSELMALPPEARAKLAEALLASLGGTPAARSGEAARRADDPILGMFSDEPELMDQIIEDAMHSREVNPLRLPNG